jgi:hypothetical protein
MRGPILPVLVLATTACGLLSEMVGPIETELERGVKAHDVEAVWTYLAVTPPAEAASIAYSVYELALKNLSANDSRTVEILDLVLARNPRPPGTSITADTTRPADAEFLQRESPASPGGAARYRSAVELASDHCSHEGVQTLIDNGLSIASVGVHGALVTATSNGCDLIVQTLLDAGADVNGRDRDNQTPLAAARRTNNQRMVTLLLARGAHDP